MDEEKEVDDGYVTLVNAKREDGKLVECKERTGIWAWKHPHHDGTLDYVEVKGHIELRNVDFPHFICPMTPIVRVSLSNLVTIS